MYIQRKKYRQLQWASTVFVTNWKRLQVQRYVAQYRKAVYVVRKFIIGFMNRRKPKCEENIYVSKGGLCVCMRILVSACYIHSVMVCVKIRVL